MSWDHRKYNAYQITGVDEASFAGSEQRKTYKVKRKFSGLGGRTVGWLKIVTLLIVGSIFIFLWYYSFFINIQFFSFLGGIALMVQMILLLAGIAFFGLGLKRAGRDLKDWALR